MIVFLRMLLLILMAQPAFAQDTDETKTLLQQLTDTKIRIKATPSADGILRDGEWSSVHVTLENLGDPVVGTLRIDTRTASGAETYRRRVELPSGARKDLLLYYKPGTLGTTRRIDFSAGTRSRSVEYRARFAQRGDVAIGVLGDTAAGIQSIQNTSSSAVPARAPQATSEFDDQDDPRKVHVGLIALHNAPDRSQGYDAFNWLVWPQADPSKLTPAQVDAVRHWVAGGGHLFLTATTNWRQLQESPLAPALPVRLTGVQDTSDWSALLDRLGGSGAPDEAYPMAKSELIDADDRTIFPMADSDVGPAWVAGTYGLGTVHLVMADFSVAPVSNLPRERMWRRLLSLPAPSGPTYSIPPGLKIAMDADSIANDSAIGYGQMDTQSVDLMLEYLQDIPGVAPLPITWLLIFSGLYLLVIGPFDYFVLKAIGRQPLTWITFPIYIIIFSTVALVGTSWIKGSQAVVMRYEIVDILPGTDLWRGSAWFGIWSTSRSDLSLVSTQPAAMVELIDGRGYQEDVGFVSGQGPVGMTWRAQTWTESHARTTWTNTGSGNITVVKDGDRYIVHNNTNIALADARLYESGQLWQIGTLGVGATQTIDIAKGTLPPPVTPYEGREQSAEWGMTTAVDFPEARRGHVSFDEWAVVIGRVNTSIEQVTLAGLTPDYHSQTLLRAPVHISHSQPESTP
ncbi:MAG: hypothetical protein ACI9MC_002680 [Kiritimatiellia bacterium]|jgi:hypothetical protein